MMGDGRDEFSPAYWEFDPTSLFCYMNIAAYFKAYRLGIERHVGLYAWIETNPFNLFLFGLETFYCRYIVRTWTKLALNFKLTSK